MFAGAWSGLTESESHRAAPAHWVGRPDGAPLMVARRSGLSLIKVGIPALAGLSALLSQNAGVANYGGLSTINQTFIVK